MKSGRLRHGAIPSLNLPKHRRDGGRVEGERAGIQGGSSGARDAEQEECPADISMASVAASDLGVLDEAGYDMDASCINLDGDTCNAAEDPILFEEDEQANDAARLIDGVQGSDTSGDSTSESGDDDACQAVMGGTDEKKDHIIRKLQRRVRTLQRKFLRRNKTKGEAKKPTKNEVKRMLRQSFGLTHAWAAFVTGKRTSKGRKKVYYTNKWEHHEIVQALVLRARVGARGYDHIRKHHLMPLPSRTCLRRHVSGFDVDVGIINSSVRLLKKYMEEEQEEHRTLAVLSYDEMAVDGDISFDQRTQTPLKSSSKLQVAMIRFESCKVEFCPGSDFSPFYPHRGLTRSFKIPIFCGFDCQMTKDLLKSIVKTCEEQGARVVATTSDMAPDNRQIIASPTPNWLVFFGWSSLHQNVPFFWPVTITQNFHLSRLVGPNL